MPLSPATHAAYAVHMQAIHVAAKDFICRVPFAPASTACQFRAQLGGHGSYRRAQEMLPNSSPARFLTHPLDLSILHCFSLTDNNRGYCEKYSRNSCSDLALTRVDKSRKCRRKYSQVASSRSIRFCHRGDAKKRLFVKISEERGRLSQQMHDYGWLTLCTSGSRLHARQPKCDPCTLKALYKHIKSILRNSQFTKHRTCGSLKSPSDTGDRSCKLT